LVYRNAITRTAERYICSIEKEKIKERIRNNDVTPLQKSTCHFLFSDAFPAA
jgi:hypothetical protein